MRCRHRLEPRWDDRDDGIETRVAREREDVPQQRAAVQLGELFG